MKNENEFIKEEHNRLLQMKKYELENKTNIIAGIDEVGRGPLAGPVVAVCIVLDINDDFIYLNDSKKVSEKRREVLYDELLKKSKSYGIGIVDNNTIDKINILNATYIAMEEAYKNCDNMYYEKYNKHIDLLLIDALELKNINVKQIPIIKGDEKSVSIAAASVVAKVYRDRLMVSLSEKYNLYGFEKHKGYGTKLHIDMLKKYGPCEIHRQSFIKNII